jgi:hypothetical protein
MPFEFGDVLLVPFPFTSQRASKKRPRRQQPSPQYCRLDLIVMAVTSRLRPDPRSSDVLISHWQAAGLLKPSVVTAVFATLEQQLVPRRLGTLDDDDQAVPRQAISEIIG